MSRSFVKTGLFPARAGALSLLVATVAMPTLAQSEEPASAASAVATDAATQEPEIGWMHDPAKAIAAAQESGRPIVAYVTSSNCAYCRKMEKRSWSDPRVAQRVSDGYVALHLTTDKHPKEVSALRVRAFPTTVVLTPQGQAYGGATGYLSPEKLSRLLRPTRKAQAAQAAQPTQVR